MEIRGNGETQSTKSEKCIMSFSLESGGRTLHYLDDYVLMWRNDFQDLFVSL
jgi:hypothetical protein